MAKTSEGKPAIHLELFHPVPSLANTAIAFELLSGTTLEQARKLSEIINERVIGVSVTSLSNSP